MESTIVIKVKYGETLRRSSARVNEAGQLDIDMAGLREKVIGLFSFAPDVDLILAYIDEDGDVVTLVDEEDLHDAMGQSLNPLRITVKLNAEKSSRSCTRSSGSSTPMKSPRVQHPLPNLNSSVSNVLKSIPEPFSEEISKLSLELLHKAASSAPGFAELFDSSSRKGRSYKNLLSEFLAGTGSGTYSGASGSAMSASMTMAKEPDAPKDDGATTEVMPNAKFEELTDKINQKVDLEKGTRGVEASVTPVSGCLNLNDGLPADSPLSGSVSATPVASRDAVREEGIRKYGKSCLRRIAMAGDLRSANFKSVTSNFPASDNKEVRKSNKSRKSVGVGTSASASTADSMKHSTMDSKNSNFAGNADALFPSLNLLNECPFTGMPVASDFTVPLHSPLDLNNYGYHAPPFQRSYKQSEGLGGIFHRGVRCDGCGVHPITGPRFKSKVKGDYDLCNICFQEMGNEADYVRIDRPITYRHPYSFKGLYDPHPWLHPPTLPPVLRGHGMKPSRPKFDSQFIVDVNVPDGTFMAPSTPFTKIWRMRNNGTIIWPQGTQLVWIGGDKLNDALPVELQISLSGLPLDNELDVAVDFTAPELPGRYTSHWRMASPSGQKFGQRIWVHIQVEASLKDSLCESFHGLNLNLPPDSSGLTGPELVYANVEPVVVEDSLPKPNNSNRAPDLVVPIVEAHQKKDQDLYFPVNDTLLVGEGVSNHVTSEAPTSVSYPVIDLSEVAPVVPSHVPSTSTNVPASAKEVSENNEVEQTLLRELEEMGFRQVDLNKEVLRKNEYDLEQSVDDLCGVSEWDPILEELQEMGFCDEEMNKALLKKNNGSIKRVVMELIAGEKA